MSENKGFGLVRTKARPGIRTVPGKTVVRQVPMSQVRERKVERKAGVGATAGGEAGAN